jgi:hypothetical protein
LIRRHRYWLLLFVFTALVLASRLPFAPPILFSFDDVNFAYSIGHFDIRIGQPQPPGYPLFVLEMRLLDRLRFKRPESNLLALRILGSIVALLLLAWFGDRVFGGDTGLCAASLLLFHPSFWYSGLTSAIRLQLAAISIGVAAFCYPAWTGNSRWIAWSAVALGIGAGIRPEMGVLLFPLWWCSLIRAEVSWRQRLRALALLAAVVLAWLVPTAIASGGPVTYFRTCWLYLSGASSLTSSVFGAEERLWRSTIGRLMSWTVIGLLTWPLTALLAWSRSEGFGFTRGQILFLAVWLVPSLVFAILVHIADAGHALAMVPIVCLAGGHLLSRAATRLQNWVSPWHAVVLAVAPAIFVYLFQTARHDQILAMIPVICLAAGFLMSRLMKPVKGWLPRWQGFLLLLLPTWLVCYLVFFYPWYYKGPHTTGWKATAEQFLGDIYSGFSLSSLGQIRETLRVDGSSFKAVQDLSRERPGKTLLVWEEGLVAWRKAAYYFPNLPVLVLDRKGRGRFAPPVARIVRGPHTERWIESPPPLRIQAPAGIRLIWLVNRRTDFYNTLMANFALNYQAPLDYHDLPEEHGSRHLDKYLLIW